MQRVGIVGASGYAGAELVRLISDHPELEVVIATGDSQAGTPIADLYPHLAPAVGGRTFDTYDEGQIDGLDVVFFALPHGASQALVPKVIDSVGTLIDVAADFRLKDASLYDTWYGEPHTAPELIDRFAYGIPELFRDDVISKDALALPGCYPTCAALGLAPLARAGTIETTGVVVDAISGVTGAGRKPQHTTLFATVDSNVNAYGLLNHRHTPEIEQASGCTVLFTPHLAPMNRGILCTSYAKPTGTTSTDDLLAKLDAFYADAPFVTVSERSPSTKATLGSNSCHLSARYDERTNTVIVLAALDNLAKGTAGQAVQCLNLRMGLPETTGLSTIGVAP